MAKPELSKGPVKVNFEGDSGFVVKAGPAFVEGTFVLDPQSQSYVATITDAGLKGNRPLPSFEDLVTITEDGTGFRFSAGPIDAEGSFITGEFNASLGALDVSGTFTPVDTDNNPATLEGLFVTITDVDTPNPNFSYDGPLLPITLNLSDFL